MISIQPKAFQSSAEFQIGGNKLKTSKQTRSRSIVACFKKIYTEFQETTPPSILIQKVAAKYDLQLRRIYDFFNVLTSLNVCQQIDRSTMVWQGPSAAQKTFMDAYADFERESLTTPFEKLFWLGNSPSLKTIGTGFMALFFALGVDTLPLHQVSSFFCHENIDKRSLERRMYLVLSLLEIMGFLTHTSRSGEYVLAVDAKPYIDYGMKEKFEEIQKNECSDLDNIECLLSRFDNSYIQSIQAERQRVFSLYDFNENSVPKKH